MADRAFARALWVQALAAGSALALSAASPAALAAMLAIGGAVALVFKVRRMRLSRRMESAVALLACAAVPVDIALSGFELAPALSRFLLILQLAKLLGPRERRDEGTIFVVALVHMAVAASSTVELEFAPLVFVYGASAAYALALRELRGPAAAPANPPVRLSFRATIAGVEVASVVVGGAIFLAIPRVGAKLLPIPRGQADRVSGYSDSIALDEAGRIRQSGKRAFRADVIERGRLPESPYWRGQALCNYDGATWSPSWRERSGNQFGTTGSLFDLDLGAVPRAATVVDIYLDPMTSPTLFTPGLTHTIEFKTPPPPIVSRDAFGALLNTTANTRATAYRLVCVPGAVLPAKYVDSWGTEQMVKPARVRQLCLQLPAAKLDVPRLRELALTILRQNGAERAPVLTKARTLADHLENSYAYTLDARKTPGVERVTDFLFTTKEGHCEVFAGALAVLLRTIDIPSRIVNGFRGGDYSPWTDTYTVLDKHAHAWVEALCDEGWVTLDPTPPAASEAERTGLMARLEDLRTWFEIKWFTNVVAFDMNDQFHLVKDARERGLPWVQSAVEALRGKIQHARGLMLVLVWLLAAGLVLGTALATIGPRRLFAMLGEGAALVREALRVRTPAELAARELEPVLRALERHGIARSPGDTAEDLARSAVARLGDRARPFALVVPAYYAARYGGRELTEGERAAIREAARALGS
jgi:transglutaminase-like putative cysteine protease